MNRFGFHFEIHFGVNIGRRQRNVPEPGPNRIDVHAGTQEVGRRRPEASAAEPNYVWTTKRRHCTNY